MVWRTIPNTEIDTGSPVTVELITALRDNPGAIAEGASGAPKIHTSNAFGNQAGAGNIDFTGLDDFGGGRFFIRAENTTAGSLNVQAAVSDGTFGSFVTIFSVAANTTEFVHGYWHKLTGNIQSTGLGSAVFVTPITSAVHTFRVASVSGLNLNIHFMADGGPSVT